VPLPEARFQEIVARAGGNPFFLEELTWHAMEQGQQDTSGAVPETVQAVLAARMDRLPPAAKHLLQTAAVIGMQMGVPLLQAVTELSDAALHTGLVHLQAAEFLYETRVVPDITYTFKHALTQEVAYGSLLQERRWTLHARIVVALEGLAADRLAEQVERLAHHALRGEVWDKAVAYCRQAGAMAITHLAYHEAVMSFEQALDAFQRLPAGPDTQAQAIDLRLALRNALHPLGERGRSLALLGETEALARALDDRARLGRVLVGMADERLLRADLAGALAAGQQALAIAAELGDSALQISASHSLAQVYSTTGDYGQAAALWRWNVEALAPSTPGPNPVIARARLAAVLSVLGTFAEGLRYGAEALGLAMEKGRGFAPIVAHSSVGFLYLTKGDLTSAVQMLEQALALCRAADARNWLRGIKSRLGYAYALAGRLAEGHVLLEDAIRESLRTGVQFDYAPVACAWLSEVCLLAGHVDEAMQHAGQALALARQHGARGFEAFALCQLGAVHAQADPPDVPQSEARYREALVEPGRGTRHAPTPGSLSPWPRHPVCQERPAGAGPRCTVYRHRAIPYYGDDLLAPSGGGDPGAGGRAITMGEGHPASPCDTRPITHGASVTRPSQRV
jgi:tetratricopeptide (TPR) repeat protein